MLSLYSVLITNIRCSTFSKTDDKISVLLNHTIPVTHLWNACAAMESCETNIRTWWKKQWKQFKHYIWIHHILKRKQNIICQTENIIRPKLVLMRWSLENQIDNSLHEWIQLAYGPGVEPISDIVCRTRAVLAMLANYSHLTRVARALGDENKTNQIAFLWLFVCRYSCLQRQFYLRLLALPQWWNANARAPD